MGKFSLKELNVIKSLEYIISDHFWNSTDLSQIGFVCVENLEIVWLWGKLL